MANNYDVNYDDKRFAEVEADKKAALNEVDVTYGNMISQSDAYYQKQIDASEEWADKQSQLQQEQTDFAIEKIEQEKAQAEKDYLKEQSGAYVDWQKQSGQYGASAEQMAASGMANTGFSESSQVSMYNTYQNRVAAARESFNQAVLSYNNSITEARLQNNSALAEIAYEALQKQLELSLQGFQYKNQLILDKASKRTEVENTFYNRYQDVLQQINTENALAEEVRQFNVANGEDTSGGTIGYTGSGNTTMTKKGIERAENDTTQVDVDSALKLGYGAISAATLNKYVEEGYVEEYIEDGVLKFRRTGKKMPGGKSVSNTMSLLR